ncbi:MAG: type IX secretion system membrane protein PorP/SprF [Bacteroidetes bacterium]|nr:MAG: type IX secretion system membrane protein PorP/SprF [Bacteroidota bacterium]
MANKSFIITILALIFNMQMGYSQDPEFSQFYANPLYLNPALAGATICPRVMGNFRDQWPSIGGAYVTYNAAYDQYVDAIHGGVGLLVTADRTGGGKLNTTEISLIYAYKFNISAKLTAAGAVQAGYYQRHLSWDNLVFEDMIDPRLGVVQPTKESAPDNPTIGAPDFAAGVMLGYNEQYYGGVSVSHLSQPKFGFYSANNSRLDMKFTMHAGGVINLKEGGYGDDREFSISPNILYQQQFKFHQLNVGTYLTIDPLIIGVWFRHNFENADALIPFLGVHYQNFRFGFSYDVTLSRLKGVTGGAYEASASWQFPCIEKRRHIRAIKCPRF